jgi:hypothetical protein
MAAGVIAGRRRCSMDGDHAAQHDLAVPGANVIEHRICAARLLWQTTLPAGPWTVSGLLATSLLYSSSAADFDPCPWGAKYWSVSGWPARSPIPAG